MFPLTSGSPSFLIKMEEDADKCWTSSQRIEFVALFLTVKHLLPLTMGTWRGVCRTVEGKKIVSGYFLLCCITDKNDAGGQWVGKNGEKHSLEFAGCWFVQNEGSALTFFVLSVLEAEIPFPHCFLCDSNRITCFTHSSHWEEHEEDVVVHTGYSVRQNKKNGCNSLPHALSQVYFLWILFGSSIYLYLVMLSLIKLFSYLKETLPQNSKIRIVRNVA